MQLLHGYERCGSGGEKCQVWRGQMQHGVVLWRNERIATYFIVSVVSRENAGGGKRDGPIS